MENNEPKKNKAHFGTGRVWLAALLFAALLTALVIVVIRFGPRGGQSDPNNTPSPTSEAILPTGSVGTETPEETNNAQTPGPTMPPNTITKTALRIGGDTVIVLASRQAAEELVRNVERHFMSYGGMPDNAIIELRTPMTLETAGKDDVTTPYDEAFEYLTGDNTPLMFSARASVVKDVVTPYNETRIEDEGLPIGMRVIEVSGRDGLVREYHETHYLNGILRSDEVTETVVIFNAVDAVIREGVLELGEDFELTPDFGNDPTEAQGFTFIAPVKGEIIKYFGPTEGAFHQGIDIAAPNGADVFAACDGTVVAVMDRGAYGLLVEIDHGSDVCTRYSRLRSTTVSIGDTVVSGQIIGKVAGTDYSSFLHFELRIRGVAYNPLKILPEIDVSGKE